MSHRKLLTNIGTDILFRTKSRKKNHTLGWHVGQRWIRGYAYLEEMERFVRFVVAEPDQFRQRLRARRAAAVAVQLAEIISDYSWPLISDFWEFAFFFPKDIEDPDVLQGFINGAMEAWRTMAEKLTRFQPRPAGTDAAAPPGGLPTDESTMSETTPASPVSISARGQSSDPPVSRSDDGAALECPPMAS
ncbi:MAG TPA: hypothetical protein VGL71_05575 [Urbifossiella sp.]|jgi:hypothetical protein